MALFRINVLDSGRIVIDGVDIATIGLKTYGKTSLLSLKAQIYSREPYAITLTVVLALLVHFESYRAPTIIDELLALRRLQQVLQQAMRLTARFSFVHEMIVCFRYI